MNKFTKISATVLFAIFLTACDTATKNKTTATPEVQKAEATQTTTENTQVNNDTATDTIDTQAVEDFQKLVAWNQSQEQSMAAAQTELQQKLATQDQTQIQQAMTAFKAKVDDVLKSLEALDIKNAEVNTFKEKTKETLVLSNSLIEESVKAMGMGTPTEEAQKTIQEKSQQLMQSGEDLQKLQAELQQKYGVEESK
ncbi:lipoprotein HlpB [Otariodibacter sp.]|uniref:lipoprotein HlpB n=1 Tax=Otariodibacter sp. TaxID=3030919 RepID=UPI002617288B|nr:lipoprotein HlpB [Otariodibacter sp.]